MDQLPAPRFRRAFFSTPAVAVGGIGVVVGCLLWFGHGQVLDMARANSRNLALVLEARLSASLSRSKDALMEVAGRLDDVDVGGGPPTGRISFRDLLRHELQETPEIRGLQVFDAQGRLLASVGANGAEYRVGDEPLQRLRADRNVDFVYDEVKSPRAEGRHLVLLRALRDDQGGLVGLVSALVDMELLRRALQTSEVGERGLAVLCHSDDLRPVMVRPPSPVAMAPLLAAADGLKAGDGLFESSAPDGVQRLVAYRRLEGEPFIVLVGLAAGDVLAGWRLQVAAVVLAALGVTAVLFRQRWRLAALRRQEVLALERQREGERRLAENQDRLDEAMDMAAMAHWAFDVDTGRGHFDERLLALHGTPATELATFPPTIDAYFERFLENDEVDRVRARMQACIELADPETVYHEDVRVRCPDQSRRWLEASYRYVPARGGSVAQVAGVVMDATERRQAEERLRLLAEVFEHSGEAILVTDAENRIVSVNRSFTRLTGYELAEVRGQNPRLLAAGRSSPDEYRNMWQAIHDTGGWQGEIWDRRKDGSCYPKLLTISTLRNEQGRITHYIGSFTDISERKATEQQIHHLAHHDSLTALPNRYNLHHRLSQAVATARRECRQLAVMFIDLDHFKRINDTLGHPVGDALLVQVGERLRGCVRESDVVARLGGDEFVVAMTDIAEAAEQIVPAMARKISRRLATPYRVSSQELHVTPSIGIALFPADGDDVDTLMKNADTAMYHAKAQGRKNFQFFTHSLNEAAAERLEIESCLRQAIERGEFMLHFQPQIMLAEDRVGSVEALVRWQHPQWGLVMPDRFIGLAEETGLIEPLGDWVLEEACRQLLDLRQQGFRNLRMAVNLSAHQLRHKGFGARLQWLVRSHGFDAGELELEITESVTMEAPELAAAALRGFRDLGVELTIDDFGTGYSSLSRLKLLPIQRIKLDRCFVRDLETDANAAAICRAIIAMAHSLGLRLVAEGVENEAQFRYLKELGCDDIQGYYFSRPLPAAQLVEYLSTFQSGRGN